MECHNLFCGLSPLTLHSWRATRRGNGQQTWFTRQLSSRGKKYRSYTSLYLCLCSCTSRLDPLQGHTNCFAVTRMGPYHTAVVRQLTDRWLSDLKTIMSWGDANSHRRPIYSSELGEDHGMTMARASASKLHNGSLDSRVINHKHSQQSL